VPLVGALVFHHCWEANEGKASKFTKSNNLKFDHLIHAALDRFWKTFKQGYASMMLPVAPLSTAVDEQRNFDRIEGALAGTLFVDDVRNRCTVIDVSPGGAHIKYGHSLPLHTRARLHIDGFGSFDSLVIRCEDGELGLLFVSSDAKRFQIIDKLAQFVEGGTTSTKPLRRHERTPANAFAYFTRADGYLAQCFILDISLHKMSVKVLVRPPIGEIVSFGGTYGRVTLHHDHGVVIQFVKRSTEQLAATHNYLPPQAFGLCPGWQEHSLA
jgi:hypothetical protein